MNYNIIYSFIFLSVILFIGIITSYEDFRTSKIRNKWILIGLVYPGIIYLFCWILFVLIFKRDVDHVIAGIINRLIWNFDKWYINLVISTVVSYLLWHFKVWAAGDAKLFICYAALIPMGQYSRVYFKYYFASFSLLLNIFIPATLFLFLKSLIYFKNRSTFSKAKLNMLEFVKGKVNKFKKLELIKIVLGFFVLFLFFKVLRQAFNNLLNRILPDQNVLCLISLLIFQKLSKIFNKNIKFIIITFIILALYVGLKMHYSYGQFVLEIRNILGRVVLIVVLFPLLKKITDLYVERTVQKITPFAHWMFLGAILTWFHIFF